MTNLATTDPLPTVEILLRLLTAFACGAVIGLNRDFHRKPAGFRTFGLVSIASAVVVMVMHQTLGADANAISRVIQGVVTGIGFIGAGVIMHGAPPHRKVAGLTTAAAVWLTAVLGMAAGSGQYTIALFALLLAMLLLLLGGPFERMLERLIRRGTSRSRSADPERKDDSEPPPGAR